MMKKKNKIRREAKAKAIEIVAVKATVVAAAGAIVEVKAVAATKTNLKTRRNLVKKIDLVSWIIKQMTGVLQKASWPLVTCTSTSFPRAFSSTLPTTKRIEKVG